jgi:predicted chitinase
MLAMFLAQLAHESEFAHLEELKCVGNKCAGDYGGAINGKYYHGRGFIQLTWPDNYKKAGQGIGKGEGLFKEPEQVAKDPKIAVKVSIWYWDNIVMKEPGVKDGKQYGLTTKANNGPLECGKGGSDKTKRRYKLYQSIAKAMGIKEVASEAGC